MAAKRHHYVPQHYLRRFVPADQKADQLWCYDKTDSKVFKSSVANLAVEVGFHWFEIDGAKFSAEESLAQIEDGVASAVDWLIDKGTARGITTQVLAQISLFVGLQELRTPLIRKLPAELQTGLLNKLPQRKDVEAPLTEDELTARHIAFILDALPEVASIIAFHLKWTLCHNGTPFPLWTSDNPVFRHNARPKTGIGGNHGLLSPGIQLQCPLSSEWLLLMCDPDLQNPDHGEMNERNVLFYNTGQIRDSRRYIYCSGNDFGVANSYLSEHPEYRDPDRTRMQVG